MASDDKAKRAPQDKQLVSLGQRWEVRYWTEELGCTADELREAVAAVGSSAAAVRAHLRGIHRSAGSAR